jgi:hypothetical protein
MDTTEFGIDMDFNDEQPKKALSSITVTVFGIDTLVSDVQPLKASEPIDVT